MVKDRDQYADIIRLRTGMNTLIALQEEIESRQKTLQQTASSVLNKTEADFKGDRLAYLRNEIRREEQNIRQKKLEAEQEKFKKEKLALKHAAERLGFDLNEDALGNADKTDEEIRRLIDRFAELRWQEDYGSFFYRKERYYNGNYRWHFMWFLAGGEKANSRETFQILHLLYRYRQDGDRTERIIFPFISNVTDGKNSRFTFMWRIFNIKKQEGKVSGHIFFIPFHLP